MPRSSRFTLDTVTTPEEASRFLSNIYGEDAGAEALLRAFLCERDLNRDDVRFWLDVYDLLALRAREQGGLKAGSAAPLNMLWEKSP